MKTSHVWIHYVPRLYQELFTTVLNSIETIRVLEMESLGGVGSQDAGSNGARPDVILLSVDENGFPDVLSLVDPPPEAKLLAFSPAGDFGWRRLPGESRWEKLSPFSFDQLVAEIGVGRRENGKVTG